MSAIRTMCPYCISTVDLDPPEILLLPAPHAASGSYAYYCHTCERVTVAAVSPAAFAMLVTAGVQIPSPDPAPRLGHALCVDDLLEFHRLLDTPDWFTLLLRQR